MIAIGSDHAGLKLKEDIKQFMDDKKIAYQDFGTYSEASCHYPDFAQKVAEAVASGSCELGFLLCGTGVGMSMAANKIAGIRAACCSDTFSARATRAHNNANILCMGERVVGFGLAREIADVFLTQTFEGGRHQTRIDLISELEHSK